MEMKLKLRAQATWFLLMDLNWFRERRDLPVGVPKATLFPRDLHRHGTRLLPVRTPMVGRLVADARTTPKLLR